jgi:hypothetical protein
MPWSLRVQFEGLENITYNANRSDPEKLKLIAPNLFDQGTISAVKIHT